MAGQPAACLETPDISGESDDFLGHQAGYAIEWSAVEVVSALRFLLP